MGGPNRDFRPPAAPELATTWPDGGPDEQWRRSLGEGYSGIAVVGDRLYTMLRDGSDEAVVCLSTETGETVWEHRYAAPDAGYMRLEHGPGPHATPLVVGARVFTAGIRGRLLALDRGTGAVLWTVELVEDLGGTEMDRGYTTSPLALGDLIVVTVGGSGQTVVALRQDTGEVAWKGLDFDNSYSSPSLIEVGGQQQLVVFTQAEVLGVEPGTARLLWQHPHPTQYGLNISVPLWSAEDGLLFVSSAYNGGSRVLELAHSEGETEVDELWAHKQMRNHIGNSIRIGDMVVAASGDFGPVPLTAVDIRSGEVLWRDRTFARPSLIYADGKLIVLDEDGVLGLVTATRKGIEVHAKHQLLEGRSWTAPTLVGRRLYARNRESAVAVELP
jgi:outer membrane protein assembly factor BamB